uniref:Uncharacterized protein n=1 Tax=Anguilla anguilla TaxID=7936 RepID=A0A0E9UGG4_ANGAN
MLKSPPAARPFCPGVIFWLPEIHTLCVWLRAALYQSISFRALVPCQ